MPPSTKDLAINARRIMLRIWRNTLRPKIVRHAGVRLEMGDHISPDIKKWIYQGDYEKSELKGIRTHLRPSDTVMELGSGIGFISTYCAQRIGAERVHTFEGNPALEPVIKRTHELNTVQPHINMCILGRGPGETSFFIEPEFWVSSMQRRTENAQEVRVPVRSLNEEIRRIDPTFLILDIEGGELQLTDGIDLHNIRAVAMELHPDVLSGAELTLVKQRLRDAGFSIVHGDESSENIVMLRENIPAA